tara:strand:+ start:2258 stop:3493 length:1236 start_codon:yes stop_codon:yes gene_type:complete
MKDLVKENILQLTPSATLAINEKSKELNAAGKKVYNFGFGQSPFPVPEKIVSALKENAEKKNYLPMQGLPELRTAIAKHLNNLTKNNFSKDDILITPGSKEAMYIMHVAFKGEVILPSSSWVSYAPQASIANNKFHWIQTSRENNWFPSAQDLEKKIKSIGKENILLILNSPNNPSGAVCKNFNEISEVAKKYKILIHSDEIYGQLSFCNKYDSISSYYPEGTMISSSLSKCFGAGGWRLGFIAVPKNLRDFLSKMKAVGSETFSSVSGPIQYAAIEAYTGDYTDYIVKTRSILNSIGRYVYANLKSNNVLINPPQGAFYLMPEFINSKFKTSLELCDAILEDTGVALLPGSSFGFSKDKMLTRLSYTDFDGSQFLKNISGSEKLGNDVIEKYAPNIVEGTNKLSEWSKNL